MTSIDWSEFHSCRNLSLSWNWLYYVIIKYYDKHVLGHECVKENQKEITILATHILLHFLDANVNKPRQNFVTPLHLACTSGDLRIVQKLVENNARINALDGDQSTPLHKATAYNNYQVIEYLVKK